MTAEDGVDRFEELEEWGVGEWEREVEAPPRPWPAATAGYLVVLAVIGVGLVLMAVVGWGPAPETLFRPGALLVAAGICLAALLRALLSERRAGLLVLRSRRTDVLVYGALGAAAVVLAMVVPPPG